MSIEESHGNLRGSWQALCAQWDDVCELWDDPVRHRFEEQYWQEFDDIVRKALDSLTRLTSEIDQAYEEVR